MYQKVFNKMKLHAMAAEVLYLLAGTSIDCGVRVNAFLNENMPEAVINEHLLSSILWRNWVHEMSHFAKEVEVGKYLLNVNGEKFDFTEYRPEFILHNWIADDSGESLLKVAAGKARHGETQFNLKGKEAETFRQLLGEYKLAAENTDNFTFKFYSVKP